MKAKNCFNVLVRFQVHSPCGARGLQFGFGFAGLGSSVANSALLSKNIEHAASLLRAGGLVAMPTETVYGLAADAENEIAVRRIFAAKERPVDHPLIVHLADATQLDSWAINIPPVARKIATAFWPGPLTIILSRSDKAAAAVTGELATIGLRVPAHPVALALLRAVGGGLAAPSANRFGRVSPTTAAHVYEELGDAVDYILNGGDCEVGVESTILDLSNDEPAVLRPGAITATQIEAVLGRSLVDPASNATRCSGRLESHYAPRAAVELVSQEQLASRVHTLHANGKRVAVLSESWSSDTNEIIFIPLPASPAESARRLYSALREADALHADIALIVPPPLEGLGVAVADRLRKAAAKRDEV